MEHVRRIYSEHLPAHVGIIMDGNGRWARARGLKRTEGHNEGLKAAKRVVRRASELGLPCVSLYTFSTENWRRTPEEVKFLMSLVGTNLRKEYPFYQENNIRVLHSGDLAGLPETVQRELTAVEADTADFTGTTVNLAMNYGGRDEILRAMGRLSTSEDFVPGTKPSAELFARYLDRPEFPDVDLVIRTGGERRISNFLLWEIAYAELWFSDKLWPDWDGTDLEEAVGDFASRKRSFGGVR
ncbi:MAG: polyprenyl diphosphate synthase [Spirochaetaceae bacterium]